MVGKQSAGKRKSSYCGKNAQCNVIKMYIIKFKYGVIIILKCDILLNALFSSLINNIIYGERMRIWTASSRLRWIGSTIRHNSCVYIVNTFFYLIYGFHYTRNVLAHIIIMCVHFVLTQMLLFRFFFIFWFHCVDTNRKS